jgi:pimeloyl-ACP methyl ester carboxylesterase
MTHLDSITMGAVRGKPTPDAFPERVQDVELVLAQLAEIERRIPALAGRLDTGRIAIAGHSFGGLLAQAFAGMAMTDPATGKPVPLRRDPRIRCAVVFSGVGPMPPASTAAGFASIDVPMLVSVGTEDLAMPNVPGKSGYALRREPFDLAPAGGRYLLVLNGADHYLGGMVGRDDLPKSPRGPGYVRVFDEVSLAFLDATLRDSAAAKRMLAQLPKRAKDAKAGDALFDFASR